MPSSAPPDRAVLVLGPAEGVEQLQGELEGSFELVRALSPSAAAALVRAARIEAVVIAALAPAAWIDEMIAAVARSRPGLPILAVQRRNAEERPGWRASGVGILREPLLPQALSRSIEAVLSLRER